MRSADSNLRPGTRGRPRRHVLRAAAVLALTAGTGPLAGCGLFEKDPPPPPDPHAYLVAEALALAARYDAALAGHPDLADRLTPVAGAHREHAAELARVTRTTLPSGSPAAGAGTPTGAADGAGPGTDQKATLAALREAELAGQDGMARACAEAPADRAVLLGTIAAARATHLEVLR